jgi:hypothetical protein
LVVDQQLESVGLSTALETASSLKGEQMLVDGRSGPADDVS